MATQRDRQGEGGAMQADVLTQELLIEANAIENALEQRSIALRPAECC